MAFSGIENDKTTMLKASDWTTSFGLTAYLNNIQIQFFHLKNIQTKGYDPTSVSLINSKHLLKR
jgi:hypothetical protein